MHRTGTNTIETARLVVRDDGVAGSNPATPTSSAQIAAQQQAELRLCSLRATAPLYASPRELFWIFVVVAASMFLVETFVL